MGSSYKVPTPPLLADYCVKYNARRLDRNVEKTVRKAEKKVNSMVHIMNHFNFTIPRSIYGIDSTATEASHGARRRS
jgi:hypothetical protein